MNLSIGTKQNYIYGLLVILTMIGSTFLYWTLEEKWIIYRKTESTYDGKDYAAAIALYKKSIQAGMPISNALLNLAKF